MKRVIVLLLACSTTAVLATVAPGRSVSACSCAVLTDQEAFDRADVVFVGTLVEIVTPPGDAYLSTDPERFVLDVERVYKGDAVDPQTIVTARDGASCGLEIHGPGPFLVYATSTDSIVTGANDDERYANLCSGTRARADAVVPASFGAGRAPAPFVPRTADEPGTAPASAERLPEAATPSPGDDDVWVSPGMLLAIVGVASAASAACLIALRLRRAEPAGDEHQVPKSA